MKEHASKPHRTNPSSFPSALEDAHRRTWSSRCRWYLEDKGAVSLAVLGIGRGHRSRVRVRGSTSRSRATCCTSDDLPAPEFPVTRRPDAVTGEGSEIARSTSGELTYTGHPSPLDFGPLAS